ncbi:Alanyl-tRNA synthetase [Geobacillus sp. WSUCF1]|nr:Alanyl-tRNA synthetase [Geobacillus sp. WSUCF1]
MTGEAAYRFMSEQLAILQEAAQKLKTSPKELNARLDGLFAELKELERENESLAARLAHMEAEHLTRQVKDVNGVPVLAAKVQANDMNQLRAMADDLKQKLGTAVIVLASAQGGKVQLIAAVTDDLVKKGFHAGKLVKEVASRCGGGGGGRPDLAQAGGKDPSKVGEALGYVETWVKSVS